ncbi:MAG: hypothetical protein DMF20_11310 [Verrucomicrobia bacterium]|nr:MAG: hypothetical protein DMF20_11310 [Verrucomicrobiota bacterium]
MGQNEENNNPKNAPYRSQHFHFAGRFLASLERNCNDNPILSRGPDRADWFVDEKLESKAKKTRTNRSRDTP